MSAETYTLLWGVVVLLWLFGVFIMARDIWSTRGGRPIGRRRFKIHRLLTLLVCPLAWFGALAVISQVLSFWGVGWLIYVSTVLSVGVFQFVLLIISSRRRECRADMSGD